MFVVESFEIKKVYHLLTEARYNKYLFVLPDLSSLKSFDPILNFLKTKFPKNELYSGLLETIKNRQAIGRYIFINMMNRDLLKDYDMIIKLPEIYDYKYFVPNIMGYSSIPDLKMEENNYIIRYYGLSDFLIVNSDKRMNPYKIAPYVDFVKANGLSVILIGDPIKNAEIVNLTKTNPIVLYRNNRPLISDLARKSKGIVGNIDPLLVGIKYTFMPLSHEIELYESLN